MKGKFTSTVAGASILLTGVGLLSRGLGLVREIVFANSFGLSNTYDLFLVGTVIPITLNTIILYIAQNYFIPVYNRSKIGSGMDSNAFIKKSLIIFTASGGLIALVIFVFSSGIINLYLREAKTDQVNLAIYILKVYAFSVPFNASFSILAAYLYSEFDFKLPTFSQLFVNIAVIIAVLLFADNFGVKSIAYGYLFGTILQVSFVSVYTIRRNPKILLKYRKLKLFYRESSLLLIIAIEALSQIYLLSDRYFFNMVDVGGIAALNYSTNLFLLPISIISVALSTALFPSFSKSFVEKNTFEIKDKLAKFFTINLYIFIPLTFIFLFFGDIIISVIFEHGAFGSRDSALTFETLRFFSISLLFYSAYSVLNKLIYSTGLIKQLFYITIAGCTLKVLLNFILVDNLRQGGLALSSSLSYIFFFFASFTLTKNKMWVNINSILLKNFLFITINSFFALLLCKIISHNLYGFIESDFYLKLLQLAVFIIIFFCNSFITDRKRLDLFYGVFRL